ncbi:putative RNA-directed DNA polymerase from transposon X-element [Trichonephila clavipes]|nr:putative RNA-directed DNA polymerase from transposon X-element [Trichonephila clavipes]
MVGTGQLMQQSSMSLKLFGMLPMQPFPKHLILLEAVQTMVERFLPTSQKEQRRAWGIFRRYPTTDNLIAFKRAKALARRTRRQCQRILDPVCVFNHIVNYQSTVMEKVKAANSLYRDFNIPILEILRFVFVAFRCGQQLAKHLLVCQLDSYSPAFQATKNRLERTPINFQVPTTFTNITVTLTCLN